MEYVIWGVVPNVEGGEQLLLDKVKGQPITDMAVINYYVKLIEEQLGCTEVRVQTIDLTDGFNNDFKKTINI